jgi:hypothetical protein
MRLNRYLISERKKDALAKHRMEASKWELSS